MSTLATTSVLLMMFVAGSGCVAWISGCKPEIAAVTVRNESSSAELVHVEYSFKGRVLGSDETTITAASYHVFEGKQVDRADGTIHVVVTVARRGLQASGNWDSCAGAMRFAFDGDSIRLLPSDV